jgi:hypothetical protein
VYHVEDTTKPYKRLMGELGDKMSLENLVIDDKIILKYVLKLRI